MTMKTTEEQEESCCDENTILNADKGGENFVTKIVLSVSHIYMYE